MSNGVKLLRRLVKFKTSRGDILSSEAVYQDTLPQGSSIGTVIALHGAPGSHKDFKYFYPYLNPEIRFIGVNFPGFGFTEDNPKLCYDNVERQGFIHALANELNLNRNVIYMGHSRGCENALMTAVERQARGLLMLNPIGLRVHKGIRPLWFLRLMTDAYELPIYGKRISEPIIKRVYDFLKIKVPDGHIAYRCLKTMQSVALHKQKPYIDRANLMGLKIGYFYAGKDFLIENTVQEEIAQLYHLNKIRITEKTPNEEERLVKIIQDGFRANEKGYSVFLANDTHYLNKDRAQLAARSAEAILGL